MNTYQQYVEWAVIIAMAGFVLYIMKQHRDERQDWQRQNERQNDEANRNSKESINVISALKTLIETLYKR